jgi:hypothetical protein
MRCLPLLGALFLAAISHAAAQIQTLVQTQRSSYLLYERVDLFITVENVGGSDLVLDNNEGHPWLSFLVSKHGRANSFPVPQERQLKPDPVTLKVGETKTLRVNITPLFSFREEGDYRASAVIDLPGAGQMISDPVPFTVLEGHAVWSQIRSADGVQRTYSLIRFSPKIDSTQLYLRVESPDDNVVYTNIALGEIVSSSDPEVFFDPSGNLHVMQPVALGTYLYTRTDQDGKIVHQGIFKSAPALGSGYALVPPRLKKMDDGTVVVLGGLEENRDQPRERLSTSQNAKKVDAPPPAALPTVPLPGSPQ